MAEPVELQYGRGKVARRRRRRALLGIAAVGVAYVGAYGVSLAFRTPAMNLRYFYYEAPPPLTDEGLYALFYPLYRVHKALGAPDFIPHNLDRPPTPTYEGP